MRQNYLITGGAGFIGVNLVRRLLKVEKARIRILDNLSVGKAENLAGLPVELIVGDIRDEQAVHRAMAGTDFVIHLAASTGVVDSVTDPMANMSVNVGGTLNLLRAAVNHRVQRFLFASTGGAIVGEAIPPVHEEMLPRPVSPYGASKLAGEGYCSAFFGSYGLQTIALRFSNIYGLYSHLKGSVVAKFFRRAQAGKELTIFGDGSQTRDFLFVEDLAEAIVTAAHVEVPFGQAIQLGTGQETSVNELVALMRQFAGDNFPPVKYAPARAGEVQRNFVSIARAKKYLDFNPPTELAVGLKQTWDWFQNEAQPSLPPMEGIPAVMSRASALVVL